MAIDPRERFSDLEEALRIALRAERATIWTSMPGIIVSFDSEAVTAVVQPAIQGVVTASDGAARAVNLPQLLDVPVIFPRGGGVTLTFPVAPGDECDLHFSSRCIDGWWQSGGVQLPMDTRMHDLSDATCYVGPQSQVKKISGISTTTAQLRTDDGQAFIELNPASHAVNVTTVGDAAVTAGGDLTVDVTGHADVTAGSIAVHGPTTFHDAVHFKASVTGDSTADFDGDVTGAGTSLPTHIHNVVGIQLGGSTKATNPPT